VKNNRFRTEILRLILNIYEQKQGGNFDYYKIAKCQFFLNKPDLTATLLSRLVSEEDKYLAAY
jgi:predicted Ser/Thr protein kinase